MADEERLKWEMDKKEIDRENSQQRMINAMKWKIVIEAENQGTKNLHKQHDAKMRFYKI